MDVFEAICRDRARYSAQVDLHLVPRESNPLDLMVIEIRDAGGNLIEMRVSEPEAF